MNNRTIIIIMSDIGTTNKYVKNLKQQIDAISLTGSPQWTTSGNNVKNTNIGGVAINAGVNDILGDKLQVYGNILLKTKSETTNTTLKLISASDNDYSYIEIGDDNVSDIGGSLGIRVNGYDYKMIIKSNGNVGIGIKQPQYKLDVVGDINCTGKFRINGSEIVTTSSLTFIRQLTSVGFNLNTPVDIGQSTFTSWAEMKGLIAYSIVTTWGVVPCSLSGFLFLDAGQNVKYVNHLYGLNFTSSFFGTNLRITNILDASYVTGTITFTRLSR